MHNKSDTRCNLGTKGGETWKNKLNMHQDKCYGNYWAIVPAVVRNNGGQCCNLFRDCSLFVSD